jgi:thiamine pyrophosphate-dependent acetolactate synthase large subunit-like protein
MTPHIQASGSLIAFNFRTFARAVGINGIMEALRVRQNNIRFMQVRHEESAAFMACAYAKLTGRLGVCLATSGPGGIHLLNGPLRRQLAAL